MLAPHFRSTDGVAPNLAALSFVLNGQLHQQDSAHDPRLHQALSGLPFAASPQLIG